MNTNLDPKVREALLRALPYVRPVRRELLAAVLMGAMLNEDYWVVAEGCSEVYNLEWYVYRMLHSRPDDMYYIKRVNKTIDDLEAQSK